MCRNAPLFDDDAFFRMHTDIMVQDLFTIASGKVKLEIPFAPADYVLHLLSSAQQIFEKEPSLLRLNGSFVIVGDLHGHILDFYRILQNYGLPPRTNYILLGDLGDRGEFSIETILLAYTLKILFPSNVYVIRGNHEFEVTAVHGGLFTEVEKLYKNLNIFEKIIQSFSFLPLAAIVNEKILCFHGGLSPNFSSIEQIESIHRPILSYDDPIVCGILWSDPYKKIDLFMPSKRGTGFFFGKQAVDNFLENNSINCIIRGHECVFEGIEKLFNNEVITVFSASNYCGTTDNKSAAIVIDEYSKLTYKVFQPFPYLLRSQVGYQKFEMVKLQTLRKTIHSNFSSNSLTNHPDIGSANSEISLTWANQRSMDFLDILINKPSTRLAAVPRRLQKISRIRRSSQPPQPYLSF